MYGSDEPFGQRSSCAMRKMEINVSGQLRVFPFSGPGWPQDRRLTAFSRQRVIMAAKRGIGLNRFAVA